MLMLSGPVDLFVRVSFMACLVCSSVMIIGVVGSLCIFLSMVLFCLFVVCVVEFVNW